MIPAPSTPTSALDAYEPALDGMRGICIAAVVAFHACAQAGLHGWVRGGFIGVSVFFTLSGFLITSMLLREQESTGGIGLMHFWARRIRRLWPASFVVIGVVVALSAAGRLAAQSSDTIAATWSVTNWHVIVGGDSRLLQSIVGPLGPTWSLAVEEQFYVVLALTFAFAVKGARPRRTLTIVSLTGVFLPIALANVATDWLPSLEFNTVLRMPELFVGVLLAVWYTRSAGGRQFARFGDGMAAAGLLAMLALFLFVDYTPPWLLRGGYAQVAVVTAATVLGLLQRGRVAALLARQPLRWLGTVSYSLYLVHWPVMLLLTREHTGRDGLTLVALTVGCSLVAAWLLHIAVERPLRRVQAPASMTIGLGIVTAAALTAVSLAAL